MSNALIAVLFSYRGRLARAPFWWGAIASWIAFAVLFVFLLDGFGRPATWVLYPPLLWILGALLTKRLHDVGRGPVTLAWLLLPVLGPLWVFWCVALRRGTEGDNQFGPDPHSVNVDYLRVDTP